MYSLCPEKPVADLRQCWSSKIFSFKKKNLLMYCFSSLLKREFPFFCTTCQERFCHCPLLGFAMNYDTVHSVEEQGPKERMHCNLRASLRFHHTALLITTLDKPNIIIHSLSSNKYLGILKLQLGVLNYFLKNYFTFSSLYSLVPNQHTCGGFVGVILLIIFCLGEVFVCPNYG